MIKIQVPVNITLRSEIWPGFGFAELLKSALIATVVGAGALIFYFVSDSEFKVIGAMLSVVFAFAFGVGLFSKMDNNQSIFDFYKRRVDYGKRQQRYNYKTEEGGIYHVQRQEEK